MEISFNLNTRVFAIETENCGYYMGIADDGLLGHIHFGRRLCTDDNLSYRMRTDEPPFIPSKNNRERCSFNDTFPWELPCGGLGDFRESALDVTNAYGQKGCCLKYVSHSIYEGKPSLEGLPSTRAGDGDCRTLEILCRDDVLGLEAVLCYSVFEGLDTVARSVRLTNCGSSSLTLSKVHSACLHLDNDDFDFISLYGSWGRERHISRTPLFHGTTRISSIRGETSHQQNCFFALASHNADYEHGTAIGFSLVYSGNFEAQAAVDQFDSVRAQIGINHDGFSWLMEPGQTFTSPEAVLVFSDEGLGRMSRTFHDLWRQHLISGSWKNKTRPVLVNNWEATYFDFDDKKLLQIADAARDMGIEMLVMDDGWFGRRNKDDSSLGDWKVNTDKIKCGLPSLVAGVREKGLKFGIWFEPEMISPDSNLYRAHPDWAIQINGREPVQSRAQYVLDLSRSEVRDYVYESVADIIRSADISYVKWDMNRQLSDLGSVAFCSERSGELFHRFVLGVYELQRRLLAEFPNLLLENCSGGGARFDPGMLYYSPQIWCSDDCDAVERLAIHEGTALVYPLSSIGAHVAVCPNHTVGRTTPFWTRAFTAMHGSFGYELDVTKLSAEEKKIAREQIALFKKINPLVREGDYYRISSTSESDWDVWEVAAKDCSQAFAVCVQVLNRPNFHSRFVKIRGLDEKAAYSVCMYCDDGTSRSLENYAGSTLRNCGLRIERMWGDFRSCALHIQKI